MNLKGVIFTGSPGSGKTFAKKVMKRLVMNEGLEAMEFKDREYVQRSLLANNEHDDIPSRFITGKGTAYYPGEGENILTGGTIHIKNGEAAYFTLENVYAFHHGREGMLNRVEDAAKACSEPAFFLIEWGTADDMKLGNGSILSHDSQHLFEVMRVRRIEGKRFTEQFGIIEIMADDEKRALWNAQRKDSLPNPIWELYEKTSGGMPPELVKHLHYRKIYNDGDAVTFEKNLKEAYESLKTEYAAGRLHEQKETIFTPREKKLFELLAIAAGGWGDMPLSSKAETSLPLPAELSFGIEPTSGISDNAGNPSANLLRKHSAQQKKRGKA